LRSITKYLIAKKCFYFEASFLLSEQLFLIENKTFLSEKLFLIENKKVLLWTTIYQFVASWGVGLIAEQWTIQPLLKHSLIAKLGVKKPCLITDQICPNDQGELEH
jgi:hypothetical protein